RLRLVGLQLYGPKALRIRPENPARGVILCRSVPESDELRNPTIRLPHRFQAESRSRKESPGVGLVASCFRFWQAVPEVDTATFGHTGERLQPHPKKSRIGRATQWLDLRRTQESNPRAISLKPA